MAKKVFAWIGVVILSLVVLYNACVIYSAIEDEKENDLIPIEQITGIYTKATLKPGCYIDYGLRIPLDDNGVWCHCILVGDPTDNGHISVDDLWIIDVYGDYCTVVFGFSDSSYECICTEDYPLSNLNYDTSKASKADDGLKLELYGSRYTLNETTGPSSYFCVIVLYLCFEIGSLAGRVILVREVIKPRQ